MSQRLVTGAIAPVTTPHKKEEAAPRRRWRPASQEEKQALGQTQRGRPPPGVSWRAYALTMLCGDIGLILIAWGMGWL